MAENTGADNAVERPKTREVRIILRRVRSSMNCLFIGRCVLCLPISVARVGQKYLGADVESHRLEAEISDVSESLPLDLELADSEIYQLRNGNYIHTYSSTIKCSDVTLRTVDRFFRIVTRVEALPATSSVDTTAFEFGNDDILELGSGASELAEAVTHGTVIEEGKYAWDGEPAVPWCWKEGTWYVRLLHSIREASSFREIEIIPAFQWKGGNYEEKIGSHFPAIKSLCISPFHGMTDFILRHQRVETMHFRIGIFIIILLRCAFTYCELRCACAFTYG